MSRGPGKWQRLILDRVAQGDWFYLVDLLPAGYTVSQYSALHRAACRLADAGKVIYRMYLCGHKKVHLGPIGAPPPMGRLPC